jgi:hypothetical protein
LTACGADFHLTIDGNRIATDDLSVEVFGQGEREGGFSAGGGAEEDNEEGVGLVDYFHDRHWPAPIHSLI